MNDMPRLPGSDGDKGALAHVQQPPMQILRGAAYTSHKAHQDDSARDRPSRAPGKLVAPLLCGVGRFDGGRFGAERNTGAGGWANGSRGGE